MSAALAAALLACFWSLPETSPLTTVRRSVQYGNWVGVSVVRDNSGGLIVTKGMVRGQVADAFASWRWWRSGLLAATTQRLNHSIHISSNVGPLSSEDLDSIRVQVVGVIASRCSDSKTLAHFRSGDGIASEMILTGYLINCVYLTVATMFFLSLGWIPRVLVGDFRATRMADGLCTRCGYDLTGISASICPECGSPASAPKLVPSEDDCPEREHLRRG